MRKKDKNVTKSIPELSKVKPKYYDGAKLLSMRDLNDAIPEIYIVTSNRSAGKTVFFNRYAYQRFLDTGEKFILLYRYSYELDGAGARFFDEISRLFFPKKLMYEVKQQKGAYIELFTKDKTGDIETDRKKDGDSCGYVICINGADNVKKCSHLMSDASLIIFDEFQTESDCYAPKEITKFQSIHSSLARGAGEQVKYLPVIMISNYVTTLNPYYSELHITERLHPEVKFLRGNGWVLEQNRNETAVEASKLSSFNKAFENSQYMRYAQGNEFLIDDNIFVGKIPYKKSTYMCTIRYNNEVYAIRGLNDVVDNIIYVDRKVDKSYPTKYACTVDDVNELFIYFNEFSYLFRAFRKIHHLGGVRYYDLKCKSAFNALILP